MEMYLIYIYTNIIVLLHWKYPSDTEGGRENKQTPRALRFLHASTFTEKNHPTRAAVFIFCFHVLYALVVLTDIDLPSTRLPD